MSKEMSIIALGVWVIVLPYLGIYRSWLVVLMVITGLALMGIGFLLRGEKLADEHHNGHASHKHSRRSHLPFEESAATVEQDYSEDRPHIGSLN
jgi:hypothetical protein